MLAQNQRHYPREAAHTELVRNHGYSQDGWAQIANKALEVALNSYEDHQLSLGIGLSLSLHSLMNQKSNPLSSSLPKSSSLN